MGSKASQSGGTTVIGSRLPMSNNTEKVDVFITDNDVNGNEVIKGPIGNIPHTKDCTLLELRSLMSNNRTAPNSRISSRNNKIGALHVESSKYQPRSSSAGAMITSQQNHGGGGGIRNNRSVIDSLLLPSRWCFAYSDGVRVAPSQEERLRVSLFGGAVLIVEKTAATSTSTSRGTRSFNSGAFEGFDIEPPRLTQPSASYPLEVPKTGERNKRGNHGNRSKSKKSRRKESQNDNGNRNRSPSPPSTAVDPFNESQFQSSSIEVIDSNESVRRPKLRSMKPLPSSSTGERGGRRQGNTPEAILLNPLYGAEQYVGQKEKVRKREKKLKRIKTAKSKSQERKKTVSDGTSGELFHEVL